MPVIEQLTDSETLASILLQPCVTMARTVGPVKLSRSEGRLIDMLRFASFDREPQVRRASLSSFAASMDHSVIVQASALVASGRVGWSELIASWDRQPDAAVCSTARLAADPEAPLIPTNPLSSLDDPDITAALLSCCPEVRGPNALTRAGALTELRLGSLSWIAKMRAHAAGLREEEARQGFITRLGLQPRSDGVFSAAISDGLEVVIPSIARTPSMAGWTVETRLVGKTVEQLILEGSLEPHHFDALRTLTECLLERGVEWGDLSPRNILLLQSPPGRVILGLVDFEKVRLAPQPLRGQAAYQFVRAGMAVEEFGPLCTLGEMNQLFGPSWIGGSRAHRPRRELAHLLRHRGVRADDVVAVDEVDRLIWHVRRPLNVRTGRVLPGMINIRLQHYAACLGRGDHSYVLEHLLTAGFVRSLELGAFEVAVAVASDVVADLEDLALEAELFRRWTAVTHAPAPWHRGRAVAEVAEIEAWVTSFASACTATEMARSLARRPNRQAVAHGE